jgi:Ca2+-binding RTX toxin-like protein
VSAVAGGTSTIFGTSGSDLTFTGAGGLIYAAGVGNETLNAATASGNLTVFGGSGADSLATGSGDDSILAGGGSDTLNAGAGTNQLFWVSGTSGAGVTDFVTDSVANIANDTFTFIGYGAAPSESVVGGQVTLTLSDNTKVVFTNLTSDSQLNGHINIFNPS